METPIKASDLRIGSWVRYGNPIHKDLPVYQITAIWADLYWLSDGSHISHGNTNLIGIPLTSEILLKAGFNYGNKNSSVMRLEIAYTDTDHPCTLQVSGDCLTICRFGFTSLGVKCDYLHELQNLVYALTPTELTINLN